MDEYGADYKKKCAIWGANFQRSKQLKRLNNRLLELDVELELARREALSQAAQDENAMRGITPESELRAALKEANNKIKVLA
jgi:hypothetical protein